MTRPYCVVIIMTVDMFSPITLRGVTFPNRIFVPPMCQYQAQDGVVGPWHLQHYGARAAGGFGLIIAEATAVAPEGRISPRDAGLWNEDQVTAWQEVTNLVHGLGGKIGVQLGHAGRKAATEPWLAEYQGQSLAPAAGGWETVSASTKAMPGLAAPRALTTAEVAAIPAQFAAAAKRAVAAGFDAIEIHGAHGYLLHQFLSPLSNDRTDEYGGDYNGRTLLVKQVATAIRGVIPEWMPLILRISATDWLPGGWDEAQTTQLAAELKGIIDLVDVSSGGLLPAEIKVFPGYQVSLAEQVKTAGVPVAAVGVLDEPEVANEVITSGKADIVLIGRAALANPNWPVAAAVQADQPIPATAASYWRAGRQFSK